ncbi:MAG: bifunctional oligoribonuclease/PAP phosphatase NrnA [Fimbriimonadaceae bacterium]|nr:bifunctional oligoribonuclease/PAP phosphatase NrnA [Fimbriimonadaceae bacterium]
MPEPSANVQAIRDKWPRFRQEVQQARHVWVASHLNPDGDALGSLLAMGSALAQMGASYELLCHHPAPPTLRFLPKVDSIRQSPQHDADLGIILDLDSLARLGSLEDRFADLNRLVVIDHHIPNEKPGDLRIVDTGAPATCAILADLFLESELKISPDMADCLLTGITTDTGSFRFPNTTPRSLNLAAALLELGANLPRITQEVYLKRSEAAVRILGLGLSRMKIAEGGRIAWSVITRDDLERFQAGDDHTEGIVNEILSIDSVKIAAVMREGKTPGRFKGSLRSQGPYDVAAVANRFGGGGHRNAAGFNVEGGPDEVEQIIFAAMKDCLHAAR